MRRGTGKIIFWSLVTVVGGTVLARKSGVNIPGLSS
jgi:hypothetical protein